MHDIGKNLVDIILSNNGYQVINLGIKVPAETIIEKAVSLGVDVIGLSGLLVKSALVMKENLPQFAAAGLTAPVLLGGAALTEKFVARECAPAYPGPVVYCADAFAGLSALREFEAGTLNSTTVAASDGPRRHGPGPEGVRPSRGTSRRRSRPSSDAGTSRGSTRRSCSPTSTSRRSSAADGGTGAGR